MEHARHRLSGILRFLQSFPGDLDSLYAPDVVLAVIFHLLENLKELASDLELAICVKPHPRHMDVAQFAYDHMESLEIVIAALP